MSARRPIALLPLPDRITPTTPVSAKPRVDLVDAELAQLVRHEGGRGVLLEAELGMGMEVPPPRRDVVVEAGDAVDHGHGSRSSSGGRRPAHGHPLHPDRRLADAHRHALAVLAAGADAVVERRGRRRSR